ncbi:uncharacterized protein LOC107361671 [Tetranychus urticae]|uniref:uncharacterized protein LOC107361671 n=1 Tax=Tetranychus urticae TaxID=32264 RepID=UPI000D6443F6|nr:uncharacterized protein LOC107361671 [Tetranychus urticae]XP_025016589.1 uncharacterized protein LOC107361671 [Tetranychus urticae]
MDDNIENEPLSFEDPDSTLFESIPVLKEKINFLEIMVQQLNSRVASLEAINFPHVTSMAMVNQEYPAEWSLKGQKDYITYAEKKLSLLKRDNEWRKNFLAIQFEGLSSESKDRIISAINKQRVSASRIVNTIAKEVLGIDAIKNYSIGCHGMAIAVGSSHMFAVLRWQKTKKINYEQFLDSSSKYL